MRQIAFACQSSFEKYARPSRREQFLQTMESVVPWSELEARIEPHYPKAGNGRQPVGLGIMLRIYFPQHWFNLSAPGAEDALYDSPAPPRPTRAPSWPFATCLNSTTYAARYSIR